MHRSTLSGVRHVAVERLRALGVAVLGVALGLLAAGCVDTAAQTADPVEVTTVSTTSTEVPRTTGIPTMRPTSAEDLGIVLDPTGRPWDNYWGPEDRSTQTRWVASLHLPGGFLEVVSGDDILAWSGLTLRDTESVDFRGTEDFDLRIVWEQQPAPDGTDGETTETVLGVLVIEKGTTVAGWGRFEEAYRTTAGFGGLFSRPVLTWAAANIEQGQSLVDRDPGRDRPLVLADLDGEAGRDTLVFANGAGAGRFEMVRGFDEDDRLVAVMIWDPRYPWRLANPDAEPPVDITAREDQLIDCIEGRRLIDKWGRCT